jgi:hypothetical protein
VTKPDFASESNTDYLVRLDGYDLQGEGDSDTTFVSDGDVETADDIEASPRAEVVMAPETGDYPQSQQPQITSEAVIKVESCETNHQSQWRPAKEVGCTPTRVSIRSPIAHLSGSADRMRTGHPVQTFQPNPSIEKSEK